MKSKEYSWAWVTADRLLSHGPCELLYAVAVNTYLDTYLYDGQNTTGDLIVRLGVTVIDNIPTTSFYVKPVAEFRPLCPVYCEKGLYVVKGSAVAGVFVQWRELDNKEGG